MRGDRRSGRLLTTAVGGAAVLVGAAVLGLTGCQVAVSGGDGAGGRSVDSAPAAARTVEAAAGARLRPGFSLAVHTERGTLRVPVAPFLATVRPDGSAAPIDPPHRTSREWATAVWLRQSAYPGATSGGVSYIYGHACHYHACSFTRLHETAVAEHITVRSSSTGTATYRICAIGLSPKSSNLRVPACAARAPVTLVLVTCAYEHDDVSTANLVVAATRITRRPR